ncbi:sensor histidine kinase [Sphaerisporangium album]|uniref:histidine kinase n=1 Tax=Sphaerisporangium album TaxID=509200 RepID=A0A367EGR7_9ACTN|nr:HAMP domain-containing sensor histidine kinase [Sphaerisporangium album]RCG17264.1 sensor histidine kinase [Sphaerisporangium album]
MTQHHGGERAADIRRRARDGGVDSPRPEPLLEQQRQFIADASHELCTPVAGLRAQLEEAQMHPDETDLPTLLKSALRDVDRLQAIVTDLLLLARLKGQVAEREPVDLAELVRWQLSAREDRRAARMAADPGVTVSCVPHQIARLVNALLDNADRHATGTVWIEVRGNGTSAELVVADDGAGITGADRERVFEPFARLDSARSRDRGGTGLGLAIARDIAHAHQGTLDVEDSPGGGACFVLRLPTVLRSHPPA